MSSSSPIARVLVVVAAVLSATAGVAWWLLRPSADAPSELLATGAGAGPYERRATPPPAAAPAVPEAAAAIRAEAFVDEDPSLPAPRAFEPWPKDGLAVEVVSRADGEPAADAEVLWLEFAEIDGDRLARLDAMRRDPEDNARRMARRFRADAAGKCVVPYCRELTLVMARRGAHFGGLRLAPTTKGPLKLEIAPDEFVALRVRDPDGKPVPHVPLDVNAYGGPRAAGFLRVQADDQGEASLKNVGLFFELFRYEPRGNLAPGFPWQGRPSVDFAPSPPPAEPIELVLPPQGAVAVRVYDAEERPLLATGLVTLRAAGLLPPAAGPLDAPGDFRGALVAGEARFPFAGVGLRLEAVARFDDGSEARVVGDGPRAAGEEVELRLVKNVRPPMFVGRATDAAFEGLADRRFEARTFYAGEESPVGPVRGFRSDFAGRIVVELGLPPSDKKVPARRPDRVEFSLWDGSDRVAVAAVDLPPDAPDVFDGGDVVFAPAPIFAAGTVVDETGAPVRYARVEVRRKLPDAERAKLPPDRAFVKDEALGVVSREDGRFEVRALRPPAAFRLVASRTGYAGEGVVDAISGAQDLKLVLKVGGSVEARLLLDSDIPRELVRVRLRVRAENAPPDAPPIYDREHPPEANGFVAFPGAPPGVGRLVVRSPSFARKDLVAIDALRVEAGGDCLDPRLSPVDLRGALRLVELELVDAVGRAVGDAEYETLLADGGPGVRSSAGRGRVRILASSEAFDVRVTSPKRRTAFVTRPAGYQRVTLGDPAAAVLAVPAELPRLEPGTEYLVSLEPAPAGPERKPDPAQRQLDHPREDMVATPGRELVLRVAHPGRYAVRWRVSMRQGKGFAERNLDLGDRRQVVDFGEFDGEVRLGLNGPSDRAVERAVRRLR